VSERTIRTVAITRKNYLFAGSHEGAKRGALIYSLVESCKKMNIEPFEFMGDIINRAPSYPKEKLFDLSPVGWKRLKEKSRN
jgi:transposase